MRPAACLAAALWFASLLFGQDLPRLRIGFHGTAATSGPPAVAWLCGTWLPARAEWPAGLRPGTAFVLTVDAAGLRIAASDASVPGDSIATASVELPDGAEILGSCAADGTEDWFVPRGAVLPPAWTSLLQRIEADVLDRPRTLDAAVLVGHLAGGLPEGDPDDFLQLGASLCGQVTWLAWRTDTHLRVRGRSGGGLLLPAVLAVVADARCPARTGALRLRAFAARDGDRAEAARRLVRGETNSSSATLRALLHGDDELRLAAIDTLVRRRAAAELPHIVEAADPSMPWASVAAAGAVHALWADADAAVRQRTRHALAHSASPELRRIDTAKLPGEARTPDADFDGAISAKTRSLLVLLLSALAVYGLWLRERLRPNGTLA